MTTLTVTATVRDATGGTGTATATAEVLDDPGEARAARIAALPPGSRLDGLVGAYADGEGPARTRVASVSAVPGAVIRDKVIDNLIMPTTGTGFVDLVNCEVKGTSTAPTDFVGLVRAFTDSHPIVRLTDSTLEPTVASRFWNGVHGWGVELLRVRVRRVVDGASVFARPVANRDGDVRVRLRHTLFEDFAYFLQGVQGENSPDGSHADGVQWQGGSGLDIEGCDFRGWIAPDMGNAGKTWHGTRHINALIMAKPDDGNMGTCRIVRNRFEGGASGINIVLYDRDGAGTILRRINGPLEVWGNVFVRGSFRQGGGNAAIVVPMVKNAQGAWTYAGPPCNWGTAGTPTPPNMWDDGTPVVHTNGGAP